MRTASRRRQQHLPPPPCVPSHLTTQKSNTGQVCPTEGNNESSSQLRVYPRFISSLKYLLLMVVIPPFLNYASLQREATLLQPHEGELVDIGLGQKLYLSCQGKGHPVVIFDAPTGMSSDVWLLIQKDVSQLTQACIYDRAGLGFSKRVFQNETSGLNKLWRESTTGRMVDDLHRLVKEAKLNSPFVFVGSELGALNARFYAHIHNWEVSDLILIDPIPEEVFLEDIWVQYWYKELLSYHQTQQFSAAIGLNRMLLITGLMQPPIMGENISEDFMRRQANAVFWTRTLHLPDEGKSRKLADLLSNKSVGFKIGVARFLLSLPQSNAGISAAKKYLLSNPAHLSAVVDEHFFINESISQVRDILKFKPLSRTTVTVITGDYYDEQLPDPLNKVVTQFQQQFITQGYPSAKWIKMKGTDKRMIYRNPKDVAKQLKKLINKRKIK